MLHHLDSTSQFCFLGSSQTRRWHQFPSLWRKHFLYFWLYLAILYRSKNPRRVYEADMQTILVISICKSAMRVVSCASLGRHYTFVVPKFNSLKYNSNHIKCVYNLLIKVKDAGDGILDKWFQLHLWLFFFETLLHLWSMSLFSCIWLSLALHDVLTY